MAIQWPLHLNGGIQSILTTQVAIYVLLAIGLNVVVGFAGLLDLGYVAFWAIGAYTAAYFTGALPVQPPFILNPFWVIPFSIVAAMLAGVLLGTPTLRLRGDYLAIVTLGFGEIIEIIANNLNGVTGGPAGTPGLIPQFSVNLFGISNTRWTGTVLPYYYLILGVAVVFMVAFSFLEHSRVGRSWTAIREDEVAADSLGINALKYKVMAFAIGASTAGFAGSVLREPGPEPRAERLHRPDVDPDHRFRDLRRNGLDRGSGDRRLLDPVGDPVPPAALVPGLPVPGRVHLPRSAGHRFS